MRASGRWVSAYKILHTFALLVLLVCACAALPEPPSPKYQDSLPPSAVRVSRVPIDYLVWWREVEACSGRSLVRFEQVRWYVVVTTGDHGFLYRNRYGHEDWVAGLAYSDRKAIVMATHYLLRPMEVRHEMGHLIGSPTSHDPEIYQRKCARLVSCVADCLTDTIPD